MKRVPSPDRRQLLAGASALGAHALLPPLPARRRLRAAVPPSERLTLGVIGIGIRGRNMLRGYFLPDDAFEVIAVCDVDTTRREDGARRVDERYGSAGCAAYVDHRELLAHDDLDAVVIATPDHWHANQIVDACRAGMDVYCEKPLTLTLHEAHTVIGVVREHGRVFQTGSQQRTEFEQRFVRACEYVRNGRIGRVLNVNVGVGPAPRWCDLPEEEAEPGLDWDRWLGPAPERAYHSVLSPRGVHGHYPRWRDYREYAGGSLADMGAHHFDIAQWGLGADESGPVRVIPPENPEAEFGAALEYADGARLTHGGPNGTTFIGTGGMIHVDRGRLLSVPGDILEQELGEGDERLPRRDGHAADWLAAIRERRPPVCDVEVGSRSVALCHLMNIAYWHRRELVWDPARWRFVGDDDANAWLDYERREGYGLDARPARKRHDL